MSKRQNRSFTPIAKQVLALSGKHAATKIWDDYLSLHALALQNACSPHDEVWEAREEQYEQIRKCYTKEELEGIINLSVAVTMELDRAARSGHYEDILGGVHMELAANLHLAQIFTPMRIADAMAEMCMKDAQKMLDERGYLSILDPAVGGGACLIGAINALHNQIEWQKNVLFVGQDLDERCIHQAYIQLSLYGAQAVLKCGDSLTDPFTFTEMATRNVSLWRTPILEMPYAFNLSCRAWENCSRAAGTRAEPPKPEAVEGLGGAAAPNQDSAHQSDASPHQLMLF